MLRIYFTSLISFFVCFSSAPAFEDGASGVRYETGSLSPLNMPPTFDNGYLAVYEYGGIAIYGRDRKFRCRIHNPDHASIRSVAIDGDGAIAASVSSGDSGSVWLWNSTGSNIRVVHADGYLPSYVAFAPDGSLWTTGTRQRQAGSSDSDYQILRHFSREGKLLGAYIPRSSFPPFKEPAEAVTALRAIRIANGRIGMYFPGGSGSQRVWVETDLNGKEIGRWLVNFEGYPLAVTDTGAVYARGINTVHLLDRATGKWNPIAMTPPGDLVGAEGESLVFADRGSPLVYRTEITMR